MIAIEATGLMRRFPSASGGVQALDGLSFSVNEGELFGLVGPDGAGKTTAIRAVAGLLVPDSGSVAVLGRDPIKGGSEVRESLGLMPQQYSLYGDLTVGENLRFFGQLFCIPKAQFTERQRRLLHLTRLEPFVGRRADALSGGMYKKLALACALLHEPKVLLLDEPTNGVDPVSRRELWELLYEFVADGMAVLLSTPYMDEAERCHRVGLVHHGRLLALGKPSTLVREFDHEPFEITGGVREEVDAVLRGLDSVRAISPAGARLRVVLRPGTRAEVARALDPLGATLHVTRADFEDLYLVRVSEAA